MMALGHSGPLSNNTVNTGAMQKKKKGQKKERTCRKEMQDEVNGRIQR